MPLVSGGFELSGVLNSALGTNAVIAGGQSNIASQEAAVIGGGASNTAQAAFSSVVGGEDNRVFGSYSVIGGGTFNSVVGSYAVVAGGRQNIGTGKLSSVIGGEYNRAAGYSSIVAGGGSNTANGAYAFIGAGHLNFAPAGYASVVGGNRNMAVGVFASVGGGNRNTANGECAVVGGGNGNTADEESSVVGGGTRNVAAAVHAFVGGGDKNVAFGNRSSVGGGSGNSANVDAFVGGGTDNAAAGLWSVVGGGLSNSASGTMAIAVGGTGNNASGQYAFIGAGSSNEALGLFSFIGGGSSNTAAAFGAVVVGGQSNTVDASFAFVGGGENNGAFADFSIVGGGDTNLAAAFAASVFGGGNNAAKGDYAVACGGLYNTAKGEFTFTGGGYSNTVNGDAAVVGGGNTNTVPGAFAAVLGGEQNTASGKHSFVGGGTGNGAVGDASAVGGGDGNHASAYGSFVGGGTGNTASMNYACIGGGTGNSAGGVGARIGGGSNNEALGYKASVGGGQFNSAIAVGSVVAGGKLNTARGDLSVVGGGNSNSASGTLSVASGGFNNAASAYAAAVGGGEGNTAGSSFATVAGGDSNVAGYCGVVGGGANNIAANSASFVGGGTSNSASEDFAAVGGGSNNKAGGTSAFIGGGSSNEAWGDMSTVAGGKGNVAVGTNSFVGGGESQLASGGSTFVGGGFSNVASGSASFAGGGTHNVASASSSLVVGGTRNAASGDSAFVGGGDANAANGTGASVVGGDRNTALGSLAFIGGGLQNTAAGNWSVVAGGSGNMAVEFAFVGAGGRNDASAANSFIGAGYHNAAHGQRAAIAAGSFNEAVGIDSGVLCGKNNSASGFNSFVGAGNLNVVTTDNSFIGAGLEILVSGSAAGAAAGEFNVASGTTSFVGAGRDNTASGQGGFVGAGSTNTAAGIFAAVMAGYASLAKGTASFVGGGSTNTASGSAASVMGGFSNIANHNYAVVAGGEANTAQGRYATVSAGRRNVATGGASFVGAGSHNVAVGNRSCVLGGASNLAKHFAGFVGGGQLNSAVGDEAAIVGGRDNLAGVSAFVGGGSTNAAVDAGAVVGGRGNFANTSSFVGGGENNTAFGDKCVVSGGAQNYAAAGYAFVGGGAANSVMGSNGVVVGGVRNTATTLGFIGGGEENVINSDLGAIAGGTRNTAGRHSVVGGGSENMAVGVGSVVGGGVRNTVHGDACAALGGRGNTARGFAASIGGGEENTVLGSTSFAVGHHAMANFSRTGVLAFGLTNATCSSAGDSTVNVCADNGFFVNGVRLDNASSLSGDRWAAVSRASARHSTWIEALNQSTADLHAEFDGMNATVTSLLAIHDSMSLVSANTERIQGLNHSVQTMQASMTDQVADMQDLVHNASQQQVQIDSLVVDVVDQNTTLWEWIATTQLTDESLRADLSGQTSALWDLNTTVTSLLAVHDSVSLVSANTGRIEGLNHSVQTMQASMTDQVADMQDLVHNASQQQLQIDSLVVDVVDQNTTLWEWIATTQLTDESLRADLSGQTSALWDLNTTVTSLLAVHDSVSLVSANTGRIEGLNHSVQTMQASMTDQVADMQDLVHNASQQQLQIDSLVVDVVDQNTTLWEWIATTQLTDESLRADLSGQTSALWDLNTTVSASLASMNADRSAQETAISELELVAARHSMWIEALNESTADLHAEFDGMNATVTSLLTGHDSMSLVSANTERIDGLNHSVQTMRASMTGQVADMQDLVHNASQQQLQIDSLVVGVVDQNTTLWEWIATTQLTDESLRADLSGQTSALWDLNTTVSASLASTNADHNAQEAAISELETTIAALNATNTHQQAEIYDLRTSVDRLNTSLLFLTEAIQHMLQQSTFASSMTHAADYTTVEASKSTISLETQVLGRSEDTTDALLLTSSSMHLADCVNDSGGPCTPVKTTAKYVSTNSAVPCATSLVDTTQRSETGVFLTLEMCYSYPCRQSAYSPRFIALSWNQPLLVVASVLDPTAIPASASFSFQLSSVSEQFWFETGNRWSSFTPSDLGLTSFEKYDLTVSAPTVNGGIVYASIEGLSFAAPPKINDICLQMLNVSAALAWYAVRVNASDSTPLTYEYWLADPTAGWTYRIDKASSEHAEIHVPSSRDLTLVVTVTNVHGSSTTCSRDCPLLEAMSRNASASDVFTSTDEALLHVPTLGSAILLAGIDAGARDDDHGYLSILYDTFVHNFTAANNAAPTVSQDVVVLFEFVAAGIFNNIPVALEWIDAWIDHARDDTLNLHLTTLDSYAALLLARFDSVSSANQLDDYLQSVCTEREKGDVPNKKTSAYVGESYSMACAEVFDTVNIETGTASVAASVDGQFTVTVTTWNGTANGMNATQLISAVHGVHVTPRVNGSLTISETDDADGGFGIAINIIGDLGVVRKTASCQYYDGDRGVWSQRGVYLRGLEVSTHTAGSVSVSAICGSSHLTLFAVGDGSDVTKVVENQVSTLLDRVAAINQVDLLSTDTQINWAILGALAGITVAFVAVVVASKLANRKDVVARARQVFKQTGLLMRPQVMGPLQYEGVLRCWYSPAESIKLLALEVLTTNPFLGLLFHWKHEALVFGRGDKAISLYGAVLMSFLSSAFMFDPDADSTNDMSVGLWSVFVSAIFTNVLLLPVEHVLPFMISNVNSIVTSTKIPTPILKRELSRLSRRICCRIKRKQTMNNREVCAQTVTHWLSLVGESKQSLKSERVPDGQHVGENFRVSQSVDGPQAGLTALMFWTCAVKLAAARPYMASDEIAKALTRRQSQMGNHESAIMVRTIARFQQRVRASLLVRNATRIVEFDSWYGQLKMHRRILAGLSSGVLVTLALFTVLICLLLSGAFTEEETSLWAADVGQSLLMQLFVTTPVVGLLVVVVKLLISWLLLRTGRQRALKNLRCREVSLDVQRVNASAALSDMITQSRALAFIASQDARTLAREIAADEHTAENCKQRVLQIVDAQQQLQSLLRRERHSSHARRMQLRAEKLKLSGDEQTMRLALRTTNTGLNMLRSGTSPKSAKLQLQSMQKPIATLKERIHNLSRHQEAIRKKQAAFGEQPAHQRSARLGSAAIVPIEIDSEPEAQRARMPSTQKPHVNLHENIARGKQSRRHWTGGQRLLKRMRWRQIKDVQTKLKKLVASRRMNAMSPETLQMIIRKRQQHLAIRRATAQRKSKPKNDLTISDTDSSNIIAESAAYL